MTANKLEGKARELLAEELRREGMHEDAYPVGCGGELTPYAQATIRAIRRALGTARQSEGMVLVPREPTEAMWAAAIKASCESDEVYNKDRSPDVWQKFGLRKNRIAHVFNAMLAAAPADAGEVGRG